jgi:hypothetical protein
MKKYISKTVSESRGLGSQILNMNLGLQAFSQCFPNREVNRPCVLRNTSAGEAPVEPFKACVVSIQGYPFATRFNCQGSKPGVRHKVAPSVSIQTEASEDVPVTVAWLDSETNRLLEEEAAEVYDLIQGAGLSEDSRMSRDADYITQYLRRDSVTGVSIDNAFKPGPTESMIIGVLAESVYEDIDVWKNHGLDISSSRSLDRLRSIPGKTPPVAFETGSWMLLLRRVSGAERTTRRPSSISEVSVRPSSAARFLARLSRLSRSLTVVLICLSIYEICQYVK